MPNLRLPRPARLARLGPALALVLSLAPAVAAQIPPGYYASVDTTNAASLRATLHAVIDDHTKIPYTSGGTDTWDVLEFAMEDPADSGRILDVYQNDSHPKQGGGNSFYEREHTWPKSYGIPDDGADNAPYSDCHMLWLCDPSYNGSRGNKPFRTCATSCSELTTVFNNGEGGGAGSYPGNSNWTSGSGTTGSWETWIGRRGDVARALLYADVRYEGGFHGGTFQTEPDLVLTDNAALIAASNTGSNESLAYMGELSVLLAWHVQDPVDDWERTRNDRVAGFQGNRNPFIDHPEWVACLFENACSGGPDTTPPAVPTGLSAIATSGQVALDWDDNSEIDLAGYVLSRSTLSGGPYAPAHGGLLPSSAFVDGGLSNGVTYYYVVAASDSSANSSADSPQIAATPQAGGGLGGDPWINELHYDNVSTDTGEMVEVAGPAGTDLSGWTVVLYNGSNGLSYTTVSLSGVLPAQQGCLGTAAFLTGQMQNGSPDGLALVSPLNDVIEFLSYEGSFQALDGPASGLLSTDIGVAETNATPIGQSLQRVGSGSVAADFSWSGPSTESPGTPNAGQTFGAVGGGDCNGNGQDDACDIATGVSFDVDRDGVPDECTTPWTDLGLGLAGVSGTPELTGLGPLASDTPYVLTLTDAAPGALAVLFLSLASTPVAFKGGTLVPFPPLTSFSLGTDGSGQLSFGGTIPLGTPAGIDLFLQYWVADVVAPVGAAASNGLQGTTY